MDGISKCPRLYFPLFPASLSLPAQTRSHGSFIRAVHSAAAASRIPSAPLRSEFLLRHCTTERATAYRFCLLALAKMTLVRNVLLEGISYERRKQSQHEIPPSRSWLLRLLVWRLWCGVGEAWCGRAVGRGAEGRVESSKRFIVRRNWA